MFAIISALLGFGSSFLPEVTKYFQRKQDNEHELKMLDLQIKANSQAHLEKLEEINAQADIAEAVEIHKPTQSFGVQLLDAAHEYSGTTWGKWLIVPVFYAFSCLDVFTGAVKPIVTYLIVGFYVALKYAQLQAGLETHSFTQVMPMIWNESDFGILSLVLGYHFGSRAYKAAFGGSTQDSKRN